jgi:hypothetical protein
VCKQHLAVESLSCKSLTENDYLEFFVVEAEEFVNNIVPPETSDDNLESYYFFDENEFF